MTQPTDDLAAQMVREMQECEGYPTQLIAIARRYIEKATGEAAARIEALSAEVAALKAAQEVKA